MHSVLAFYQAVVSFPFSYSMLMGSAQETETGEHLDGPVLRRESACSTISNAGLS